MKLDMFQFIESAVEYINDKRDFIKFVAEECNSFFYNFLKDDDFFLNVNYRVKSDNSIKEKMLRQNAFNKLNHPREVFSTLNDIVGVRIECRFNSDEKMIFNRIKEEFNIRGNDGFFRSEKDEHIYLNMFEKQPQFQKNGFEIYKMDGIYVDGDEELFFELQIKSMVNVFWGEIDHRILYKNFNYMVTEDLIRNMMYSIKSNLEMVDSQLNTIYMKLQDLEESNSENTKSQLKSILSKSLHDTYILKLKNETGLLIDLRLISDLVIDFFFSSLEIDDDYNLDNRVIEIFDTINQLNRKRMVFGENIEVGTIKYRNNINEKLGEVIKEAVNNDFRWNLLMNMIFDISKDEDDKVFLEFVNYLVHIVSRRVSKIVDNLPLKKKDINALNYDILNVIFDLYCKDLDTNYFDTDEMKKLELNVQEYLKVISRPEDLLDLDINSFIEMLKNQYKYINRNNKE